jgi:hypothetical protein
MLSSHIDPQIASFLVQQRQQALRAEVEHDQLLKQVMNLDAASRAARNGRSRLGVHGMLTLMFTALRHA